MVEHERKKGHLTLWHPAFRRCPFFNLPTFGLIMLHTIKGFLRKNSPKSMSPAKRIYLSNKHFGIIKVSKLKLLCFPFKGKTLSAFSLAQEARLTLLTVTLLPVSPLHYVFSRFTQYQLTFDMCILSDSLCIDMVPILYRRNII